MLQFIYVWYSSERFFNTNLPFIYIGSHKGNLEDSYISSSKFLSIEMGSDDMQWKRIIISKFDLSVDRSIINSIESEMIKKAFNRYGKNRCVNTIYNQFGNKHFNTKGFCKLVNSKNGKIELFRKHLKPFLLNNGYSLINSNTKNKVCITNGVNNKFIEINSEIEPGWVYGMTNKRKKSYSSIPKGSICINKNNKHKFIKIEEIVKYMELGWDKGFSFEVKEKLKSSSQKGKRKITKDNIIKFVDINLFGFYINSGWSSTIKNTIPKGSICINNTIRNKYIHKDELHKYLNEGWIKGEIKAKKDSIPKGSICINNTIRNKYIHKDELHKYLNEGWIKGMLIFKTNKGKKWINNGKISKFVKKDEIELYLKNNWSLGKIK